MLDVTQLIGFGVTGDRVSWNPSDKSAAITLSDGNLSVSVASGTASLVRGTAAKSAGKWYYEFTPSGAGANYQYVGVATSSAASNLAPGNDQYGYSYVSHGYKFNNGVQDAYGGSGYVVSDVVGVAVDLDAGTITFYLNGVSQGQAYSGLLGAFFPAWGTSPISPQTCAGTANFGGTSFACSIPAGYRAWQQ